MLQRAAAEGKDVVTEGRDQGTVVFPPPNQDLSHRQSRRACPAAMVGPSAARRDGHAAQILAEQQRRDEEDATREVGPLRCADDAREVLTDGLTQEQVVDRLEGLVGERMR